ncbi:MAG: thiamine pyrophosphate-dependent enzyme [Candidatus Thorarchaeota archaeon]
MSAHQKMLLSGNEAFARGAIEAGIGVCTSYPGTPSTEIAETLSRLSTETGMYVEWSTNEKVALEVAASASWMGVPAMCSMKSLGLNVASDFLLNLNLSGTGPGGLVIVVCDDPRGHSSSNEQDSRFYARAAGIPLLEPSTCQQAKDIVGYALDLSREFEIPVMIRSTTRLSHSRGVVELGNTSSCSPVPSDALPSHLYNVPNPHLRHRDLLRKIDKVAARFEDSPFNLVPSSATDDDSIVIVSSGVSRLYAEEAIGMSGHRNLTLLGMTTTFPLPKTTIQSYVRNGSTVIFVEEVDAFLEDGVRGLASVLGIQARMFGKRTGTIPAWGEMNTDIVLQAIRNLARVDTTIRDDHYEEERSAAGSLLIPRPLTFCPGCTHRNVYWALRKVRRRLGGALIVAGDIGCYSLGVFYDHAMDTMHSMGSGIGVASGLGVLTRLGLSTNVVAVAGDSTFFHACIPGLINARHNNADLTFVILDNQTTAMTGFQPHPGTHTEDGGLVQVSIEKVVRSIGVDRLVRVDGTDIPTLIDTFHNVVTTDGFKVVIVDSICQLRERRIVGTADETQPVIVRPDLCKGDSCRICVSQYSCTALSWDREQSKAFVLQDQCVGCGSCIDVCPYDAIQRRLTD